MPAVAAKEKGRSAARGLPPRSARSAALAGNGRRSVISHCGIDAAFRTGRGHRPMLCKRIVTRHRCPGKGGFGVSTLNPAHAALIRRPERYGLKRSLPPGAEGSSTQPSRQTMRSGWMLFFASTTAFAALVVAFVVASGGGGGIRATALVAVAHALRARTRVETKVTAIRILAGFADRFVIAGIMTEHVFRARSRSRPRSGATSRPTSGPRCRCSQSCGADRT